jgi:hypothetical protein
MTAMAIQIVTKPLPGADMKRILGNLVFNARWDNFTSYGKAMDHMVGDQAVQAIAAKITASGTVEWVRSNMVRELTV